MNRLSLLCVALASACATTPAATTTFYPPEELRALDPVEDRVELLARAPEVAPSKRDDAWRAAVERAAVAMLVAAPSSRTEEAEQALALTESLPARFSFLRRSAPWLAARADVGVRAFPHVAPAGQRSAWLQRILDFARADGTTKGLAQRLAEEVVLKQLVPSSVTNLMELAFERDGDAACASPTVVRVTLALAADGSAFKPALERCWAQVSGPLTEAAKKSETRTAKLHHCAAMAARADDAAVKAACAE